MHCQPNDCERLTSLIATVPKNMYVTYDYKRINAGQYPDLWQCCATISIPDSWDTVLNEYCDASYYFYGRPSLSKDTTQSSAASKAIQGLIDLGYADQLYYFNRGPWAQENEETGQRNDLRNELLGDVPGTGFPTLLYPSLWSFSSSTQESSPNAVRSQMITDVASMILQSLTPLVLSANSNPGTEVLHKNYLPRLCQLLEKGDFYNFLRDYYSDGLQMIGCD